MPTVTEGNAEEVIVRAVGATTIVIGAEVASVGLLLSLTDAVKVEAPLATGTPEIAPVVGARASPAGSLPDVTAHL